MSLLTSQQQKVLTLIDSNIDPSLEFQTEIQDCIQQSIHHSQRIYFASQLVHFFVEDSDEFWKLVAAVECLSIAAILHEKGDIRIPLRHHHKQIVWQTSGEAQILSGDYLLAIVLKLMTQIQQPEVLELIATTTSKIALGQSQEISLDAQDNKSGDYLQMVQNRFASLFTTIAQAAVMLLSKNQSWQREFSQYSLILGTLISLKERSDLEGYQKSLLEQIEPIVNAIQMQCESSQRVEILNHLLQESMTK